MNLPKTLAFCLTLFCAFGNLVAQPDKLHTPKLDSASVIAVFPFHESFEKLHEIDYAKIVAEKVLTAIEQSKRFKVVDRTSLDVVMDELRMQKSEDFKELSKEDMIRAAKIHKAEYAVSGDINNVSCTINEIGFYKATISFSLKVIEVSTGKIAYTEDFNVNSGGITKRWQDCKEATAAAAANILEDVKLFVDKYFPLYGRYIRTDEVNKNNQMKKATMTGGTDTGFRTKQKLDVVLLDRDNPYLPPLTVGSATVIDAQPGFSVVKITKQTRDLESIEDKKQYLYFRSQSN